MTMKRNPNDVGVQYVEYPRGRERCEHCSMFVPPNDCTAILGPVMANGHCLLFKMRSRRDD